MSREKDRTLQQLKNYLRYKEVSSKTERGIIDWVRFSLSHAALDAFFLFFQRCACRPTFIPPAVL